MNKELLNTIKAFADENFCADNPAVFADDGEFAVTNPWIDHSGRFSLDDEEAVREWGLDVVVDFIIQAIEVINRKEN